MTEKYTLPPIEEILDLVNTEEGRDKIISEFRTETGGLSIEEAVALRNRIDLEVGAFVERVQYADRRSDMSRDWETQDNLWILKADIINAYGYDSYSGGEWVNSYY